MAEVFQEGMIQIPQRVLRELDEDSDRLAKFEKATAALLAAWDDHPWWWIGDEISALRELMKNQREAGC